MKNFFFIIFFINGFSTFSQEPVSVIRGKIDSVELEDTIFFKERFIPSSYYQVPEMHSYIINGQFELPNPFVYPQLYSASLGIDKGIILSRPKLLFFDSLTREIDLHVNNWSTSKVLGPTADEYERVFKPFIFAALGVSNEEHFISMLYDRHLKLDTVLLAYTRENPSSFVPLWLLAKRFNYLGYAMIYEAHLDSFDASIKQQDIWKKLNYDIKNAVIKPGVEFPILRLENKLGEEEDLSIPIDSKLILIDLWFSFCKPCLAAMPKLKTLYERYHESGFEIIGISVDPLFTKDKWKKLIADQELPWPQYLDLEGHQIIDLHVNAFPRYMLLDAHGLVLETDFSIDKLEHYLENNNLLKN